MINAGQQDIQIDQGASFLLQFECLDEDDVAISLAGATITGKIRSAPETVAVIATFTGAVISGPDGTGQVSLTPVETAAIPVDNSGAGKRKLTKYVYDIEVLFSDGYKQRILEGLCFVSPEVTK